LRVLAGLFGMAMIVVVLIDCFESILQPRRVTRPYRFARFYYLGAWALWRAVAARMKSPRKQAAFLSSFGPLSLLGIFAAWVLGLIVGFAALNWALRTAVHSPEGGTTFATYLYMSGTTFFTLGYGDVTPITAFGRALAVGESGLGFGFLAAVLSYLPVLFQAYSRREVSIATLDARAGSPASAAQLLLRMARAGNMQAMDGFLREWEMWSANLLESHLSFPVLSYYRSQHDNQSWLAALTVVLDTCALLMTQVKGSNTYQAEVTFAIARHAAVDLTLVLRTPASAAEGERLSAQELQRLREMLMAAGVELHEGAAAEARLGELRGMYEPFVRALGARLLLSLPVVAPADGAADNWQRSAWMRPVPGIGSLPSATGNDDHFG
jgi:voltage-gated potassium channel Kch